ncbi:MAG: hypothetical protein IPO64_12380 [Bacteroidetes bacterium]|nr:hypothetical protein [Bacteroidota bacterium]
MKIVYDDFPAAKENSKTKQTGIFAGVPTFIKDLNDVKGMPTLKGSSAYKIVEAKKNDKIVDQFLAITGSIILGKSSTLNLVYCLVAKHYNTVKPEILGI